MAKTFMGRRLLNQQIFNSEKQLVYARSGNSSRECEGSSVYSVQPRTKKEDFSTTVLDSKKIPWAESSYSIQRERTLLEPFAYNTSCIINTRSSTAINNRALPLISKMKIKTQLEILPQKNIETPMRIDDELIQSLDFQEAEKFTQSQKYVTDENCPVSLLASILAKKVIGFTQAEEPLQDTIGSEQSEQSVCCEPEETPPQEPVKISKKSSLKGLTQDNQQKLAKNKLSHKIWNENIEKMYESYDLQVHQAISPNKMPPKFSEELKQFGLNQNQPDPVLVDVNSRDIISLPIDHKNERILNKNLNFHNSDDELMYLINKFNLENLKDDQLRFISNFQLILADIKSKKSKQNQEIKKPNLNYEQLLGYLNPLKNRTNEEALSLLKQGKINNLVGLIKYYQQEALREINNKSQRKHLNQLILRKQKTDAKISGKSYIKKVEFDDNQSFETQKSSQPNASFKRQQTRKTVAMPKLENLIPTQAQKNHLLESFKQAEEQRQFSMFQLKFVLENCLKKQITQEDENDNKRKIRSKINLSKQKNIEQDPQIGHPPQIFKSKKTQAKIKRYIYQQELISLANRKESSIIQQVLNKNDIELKQELNKGKIPIKQAKKLIQVIKKNRQKIQDINNM